MDKDKAIASVCILAGKIMLESGAETHRVEDTMNRIAIAFGLENVQSYATPTGVNFSTDFLSGTHSIRISNRSTDLHKIAEVNRISRQFTSGKIEIKEALHMLKAVENARLAFSKWIQVIAAAFVSGCFGVMFGGIWLDFLPAFLTGGIGFAIMLAVERFVELRFIADFFASIMIGLLAMLCMKTGFGNDLDQTIIGAVMPLVPGLPITNAVRDLLAGHLVAGVSKGVEALLTAFAIGAGVAVVFAFI